MRSLHKSNVNVDVIVKKIELTNDIELTAEDVTVRLNLEKPGLPILSSGTNVPKLDSSRNNQSLKKQHFMLEVFRKDERNRKGERIGECVCDWNVTDYFSADHQIDHTCNIYKDNQEVGVICVNLVARRRLDEGNKSATRLQSLIAGDGKLQVFHEMEKFLSPRDIFFVVGDKNTSQAQGTNPLLLCKGGDLCRTELDNIRRQSVQGKLIKDLSVLPNCANHGCCGNTRDILDEFNDLFEKPESQVARKSEQPSSDRSSYWKKLHTHNKRCACEETPCGELFDPLKKHNLMNRRSEIETNCLKRVPQIMMSKKRRYKKTDTTNESYPESEATTPSGSTGKRSKFNIKSFNVNSAAENKVCMGAKKYKRKEILQGTCSPRFLVKSDCEITPQCCPICCEDISWVQASAPCPKCGLKPKIELPIERVAYDETQTAHTILQKWNAQVDKFKRRKDISALGICFCSKIKECINCHIRRTSRKPLGDASHVTNRLNAQKAVDKFKDLGKAHEELCRKTMVSRIVEEVLEQPGARPTMKIATLSVKRDSKPNVEEALRWGENQWPKRKKLLDSASEVSIQSRANILARLRETAEKINFEDKANSKDKKEAKQKYQKQSKRDSNLRKFQKMNLKQYKQRDKYPAHAYGHFFCKPFVNLVPRNMGWNWNLNLGKDRFGWRPGAIHHKTRRVMDYFLRQEAMAAAALKRQETAKTLEKTNEAKLPRLHVKKQKGKYTVVLYPFCDPKVPIGDSTDKMKPVEFTIEKADSNIRRRQIRECLKHAEKFQTDHIAFKSSREYAEIAKAIGNLRELLGQDKLKSILQSDSESEGSMDIEIGGGIVQKRAHKTVASTQVEDGLNEHGSISKENGIYYKNPYDGRCQGPFRAKPSDAMLKPKRVVEPKTAGPPAHFYPRPEMPLRPRRHDGIFSEKKVKTMTKPRKPREQVKRPRKVVQKVTPKGDKPSDAMLKPKRVVEPKTAGPPAHFYPRPKMPLRPRRHDGIFSEKKVKTMTKPRKPREQVKRPRKEVQKVTPKADKPFAKKGSKVPESQPNKVNTTAGKTYSQKQEVMPRNVLAEKNQKEQKHKTLARPIPNKQGSKENDKTEVEMRRSTVRKQPLVFLPPLKKAKPKPQSEKPESLEKQEKPKKPYKLEKQITIRPAQRRSVVRPKKQPDRVIYDASKFKERKRPACEFKDLCSVSPLTKVNFKAHDTKHECACGSHQDYKFVRC